jgi:hypothetical protein
MPTTYRTGRPRRLNRAVNKIFAAVFGYFWLPCPLCDQHFGGHEWRDIDGNISDIQIDGEEVRKAICPDCTRAGKGGPR